VGGVTNLNVVTAWCFVAQVHYFAQHFRFLSSTPLGQSPLCFFLTLLFGSGGLSF